MCDQLFKSFPSKKFDKNILSFDSSTYTNTTQKIYSFNFKSIIRNTKSQIIAKKKKLKNRGKMGRSTCNADIKYGLD